MTQIFFVHWQPDGFIPKIALRHPLQEPRRNIPLLLAQAPSFLSELQGNSQFRIKYLVHCQDSCKVLINQIYFPGWKIFTDGKTVSRKEMESHLMMDGRIQLVLTPNQSHTIEAYYGGPPNKLFRNMVVGISLLGFILVYLFEKRHKINKT